jgi:hypothetical protein
LRKSLRNKNWHLTVFPFHYNKRTYSVIFEDYDNLEKVGNNKFWLVKITFIDDQDATRELQTKANRNSFEISGTELKHFFLVNENIPNFGDFMHQFYQRFNTFIPCDVIALDERQRELAINILNNHDRNNGIYCYALKRNGRIDNKQMYRTIFNSEKTQLARPALYEIFKNEPTISFCYSEDPADELDDATIIKNFRSRLNYE